jgi:hypothetical protein
VKLNRAFRAATLTILLLFASVGAESTHATSLYSGSTKLVAGSELKASLASETSVKITSLEGTVLDTCTASSISGNTANSGGITQTVRFPVAAANWGWGGCTDPITTLEGGELEFHWISGTTNSKVTGIGFKFTLKSTLLGPCTYTFGKGTDIGVFTGTTGGSKGSLDFNAVLTRLSPDPDSGFCPTALKYNDTFTITTPIPVSAEEG